MFRGAFEKELRHGLMGALAVAFIGILPLGHASASVEIGYQFQALEFAPPSSGSPSLYDFSTNGVSGDAEGASGVFADAADILNFNIEGAHIGPSQNIFEASLLLTFTNTDPLADFIVNLDPSITVSTSHSGFGITTISLRVNNSLTDVDTVIADDPVNALFSFPPLGPAVDEAMDLSSLAPITIGAGAQEDLLLTLVFDQFHTGFFPFGDEVTTYELSGSIGIGSIVSKPVPVPSSLSFILTAFLAFAWMSKRRLFS